MKVAEDISFSPHQAIKATTVSSFPIMEPILKKSIPQ